MSSDTPAWVRLPRPIVRTLLALIALGTILLLALAWLSADVPAWWREAAQLPPNAAARAEALERGVSRLLHETPTDSDARPVELRETDANAWLAYRLPKWAANRGADWPASISAGPRIQVRQGRIRIAAAVGQRFRRRTVGVSFRPDLQASADGLRLFMRDARLILGRLEVDPASIPDLTGWVARETPPGAPFEPAAIVDMLLGVRPVLDPPAVVLGDGRVVSLEALEAGDRVIRACVKGR